MDDLYRLRIANADARPQGPWLASGGAPSFVGKVTTAAPAVGKFMKVTPQTLTGTESEGSTGSLAALDSSAVVVVLAIGPAAPVTGDFVVCRFVDNRWVAERGTTGGGGGGGTHTFSGCACTTVPDMLTLTSCLSPGAFGLWPSATLQFFSSLSGPTSGGFTVPGYVSTASFTDTLLNLQFFWFLTCDFSGFVLSRYYPVGPGGSPAFADGNDVIWNTLTCSPFSLITNSGDQTGHSIAPNCIVLTGPGGTSSPCTSSGAVIC